MTTTIDQLRDQIAELRSRSAGLPTHDARRIESRSALSAAESHLRATVTAIERAEFALLDSPGPMHGGWKIERGI